MKHFALLRVALAVPLGASGAHAEVRTPFSPPALLRGAPITAPSVTITGPGSSGDVSGMSAKVDGAVTSYPLSQVVPTIGPQTAIAGSQMQIDKLYELNVAAPLKNEAGIWAGPTFTYFGVSKEFNAANTPGVSNNAPATSLFGYAVNNGSSADVVGVLGSANLLSNGGTVFGGNLIARTSSGVTNAKLVGLEIDVEPAASATVSRGGGLLINAFSLAMPIPAIQLGGLGGGTFQNGFLCAAVTGSCNAAMAGLSSNTFIDTSLGSYSDAAIRMGNLQRLKIAGSDGTASAITTDANKFLKVVSGTNGVVITNQPETTNLLILGGGTGDLTLPVASATLRGTGSLNLGVGAVTATSVINATVPVKPPGYSLATLPASPVGSQAYCTDCREPGQAAGAGTGMPVFKNASGWRSMAGGAAAN